VTNQRTSYFSDTVSADDITGRNNTALHVRITAKWLTDNKVHIKNNKKQEEVEINKEWIPDSEETIQEILNSTKQGRRWIISKDGGRKGFYTSVALSKFLDIGVDAIYSRFAYYNYPDSVEIRGYTVCMIR